MHGGNDKDSCGTVRMVRPNVEMVGKDELWYGQFGRWIVVPAKTPFRTNAGQSGTRPGQFDRYSWMDEPRLNCSERPDLHVELVPCTDPWTGAHQYRWCVAVPRGSFPNKARLSHCGCARSRVLLYVSEGRRLGGRRKLFLMSPIIKN
ncbi:hypothetical protein F2Q69_00046107 [Brassica cretica]|uniref:Uncharacterized protein n=1 Tax=Brassica cretica TaxID=69181 RepID=A0A8S9PWA7_BRACR|nr:hypothetical protein F2Q69_00046107 [Brassica cretica]